MFHFEHRIQNLEKQITILSGHLPPGRFKYTAINEGDRFNMILSVDEMFIAYIDKLYDDKKHNKKNIYSNFSIAWSFQHSDFFELTINSIDISNSEIVNDYLFCIEIIYVMLCSLRDKDRFGNIHSMKFRVSFGAKVIDDLDLYEISPKLIDLNYLEIANLIGDLKTEILNSSKQATHSVHTSKSTYIPQQTTWKIQNKTYTKRNLTDNQMNEIVSKMTTGYETLVGTDIDVRIFLYNKLNVQMDLLEDKPNELILHFNLLHVFDTQNKLNIIHDFMFCLFKSIEILQPRYHKDICFFLDSTFQEWIKYFSLKNPGSKAIYKQTLPTKSKIGADIYSMRLQYTQEIIDFIVTPEKVSA